jgi:hypothetical protein
MAELEFDLQFLKIFWAKILLVVVAQWYNTRLIFPRSRDRVQRQLVNPGMRKSYISNELDKFVERMSSSHFIFSSLFSTIP